MWQYYKISIFQVKIAIARAEKEGRGDGPLMLVCPSGVTRCGTLAALDIIIDRMTNERKANFTFCQIILKFYRSDFWKQLQSLKDSVMAASLILIIFRTLPILLSVTLYPLELSILVPLEFERRININCFVAYWLHCFFQTNKFTFLNFFFQSFCSRVN